MTQAKGNYALCYMDSGERPDLQSVVKCSGMKANQREKLTPHKFTQRLTLSNLCSIQSFVPLFVIAVLVVRGT